MKLEDLGEDRLLARILPHLQRRKLVVAGAGDDCAIVRPPSGDRLVVLKTDCVVESVHFQPEANPVDVGWKAMMRPLSDFAATSAVPRFALVTLIVSKKTSSNWVEKIYRGLNRAAARFDVSVVGGEMSGTRGPAMISVNVVGEVEKDRWMSRRGGRAGDDLFVTGRLGSASKGKHLRFVPRIAESRWLTKNFSVHAMMDLSDGLGTDLPRLAAASNLCFQIDKNRLPCARGARIENAISDGEDYELLFTVSPRNRDRLQQSWRKKFPRLPLTRVGSLHQQSAINASPARTNRQLRGGYVHFQ
ncbi:MAG: thiamine-phosphate kinase [Chthoniobacterales bacterium]